MEASVHRRPPRCPKRQLGYGPAYPTPIAILTFQTHHAATILREPPQQHVEHGVGLVLLHPRQVVVQHEEVLLVRAADLLLQLPALDRGSQVDLARRQPPQHDRGDREVDGFADVALAVLDGAAAVQDDDLLGLVPQQREQALVGHDVVVALGSRGHGGGYASGTINEDEHRTRLLN